MLIAYTNSNDSGEIAKAQAIMDINCSTALLYDLSYIWIICVFVSCASQAFVSFHCCLVVTCWERADLLALVGDVYCIIVTFPCGVQGQVWYSILSFPDFCRLLYFSTMNENVLPSLLQLDLYC